MPNTAIAISATLNVDDARVLARSTEAVPDAANGMDQRVGLLVVDLPAHPPDIDIDDVGRRTEMKVPDPLQQHGPGDDAALVADQVFQKLEFAGKQRDRPAAPAGGPRDQVDGEIADAQNGLLGDGVAAPGQRLEAGQEFDEGKRLDQVIIAAGAQATNPVVDFAERADDQERRGDAAVAQPAHHRDAVDVRQHAVEGDPRIVASRAAAQRLAAAGRQIDLVTAGRKLVDKLTGSFRIVLDNQNTTMGSRHGLLSPA